VTGLGPAPVWQNQLVHRSLLSLALVCMSAFIACESDGARGDESTSFCPRCNVLVGLGTTYRFSAWTDGIVVPLTLELDASRWELGAFRFANAQRYRDNAHATHPYWGFTAMRRWQVLHRSRIRLYVGFGANYSSEVDYLETTRWNFAYLIAARFDLPTHGRLLEFGIRHWSNAWIRPPNRGEDLLTVMSFGF
jgi:hypothetical protein